jgi:hypothetical protein
VLEKIENFSPAPAAPRRRKCPRNYGRLKIEKRA